MQQREDRMDTSLLSSMTLDMAQSMRSASLAPAGTAGDFQAALHKQLDPADAHSPEAIRKVAGDLVSQALILPILKQIRRGTFGKNTPFSPGTGEKTFGPEFDIQIADRIAHSHRMAPTDALAARLTKRVSPANAGATTQPGVDVHG